MSYFLETARYGSLAYGRAEIRGELRLERPDNETIISSSGDAPSERLGIAVGTVPMAWSLPQYDHDLLKPIASDLGIARQWMVKAGYGY